MEEEDQIRSKIKELNVFFFKSGLSAICCNLDNKNNYHTKDERISGIRKRTMKLEAHLLKATTYVHVSM